MKIDNNKLRIWIYIFKAINLCIKDREDNRRGGNQVYW